MYPKQNSTSFITEMNEKLMKYTIPEGSKQANKFKGKGTLELFSYQKLIEEYLSPKSPYRGLLIYAGLGSGKTITAINTANNMKRDVVVLLPKSLRQNFINEIITYLPEYNRPDNYESMTLKEKQKVDKGLEKRISKQYSFVSSNSGVSAQKLQEVGDMTTVHDAALGNFIKKNRSLDNKLLIIDEVHNLLVNMIDPTAKNGTKILNMIMNAKNLRLICLSGSPVVSDPFELAILFNILRGYIRVPNSKELYTAFPQNYDDFKRFFVDEKKNSIKNSHIFQERIVGLVSYYNTMRNSDDRELLPFRHKPIVIQVPMSDYQWNLYVKFRKKEQDEERKNKYSKEQFVKNINKKPKRVTNTTFRVRTRQISDFALPPGIEKPKRKGEKEGVIMAAIKKILYDKITKKDLTTDLKKYSTKMLKIYNTLTKNEGNAFVYSEFVSLEGVGVFSRILEEHNWNNYNKTKKTGPKTFGVFSGETSDAMRTEILQIYNQKSNCHGKHMRVILATATAAEGINLKNTRQVHIMEPYWHANRIEQIIGRAVRNNSHSDLPKQEREVESFLYLSVPPKGVNIETILNEKLTTDQNIFHRAMKRKKLLDTFLKAIREIAIDCQANYEHNKDTIDECRICVPTGEPMFPPKVEDHLLPGVSRCASEKIISSDLKDVEISGKQYKMDSSGNIYKEVENQPGVYIQEPSLSHG